jgi:hypothetical protein
VNIDLGDLQAKKIQLYNLLVEEVYTIEHRIGIVGVNIRNLPAGMYTVFVQLQSRVMSSYKVIFN